MFPFRSIHLTVYSQSKFKVLEAFARFGGCPLTLAQPAGVRHSLSSRTAFK